jgi:dTDP-4-dehydrorhamnose reductase
MQSMLLIVGGDSEIGGAVYRALKARGEPVAATTRRPEHVAPGRPFLDLAAPLGSWQPPDATTTVCICAAIARLAACAADPVGTAHINVSQTLILVDKLVARGAHILFLSTNQVFDGRSPQTPAEAPHAPISEYGRQKARTEAALREHLDHGAPVAILRLSKVVSPSMQLIHDWVEILKAGKPIRAFHDMTLAPVPIDLVCAAILALTRDRARGVFQLTGPSDVTYAEVAHFIAGRLRADPALVAETSAREAGLPEGIGPSFTTLDSSLLKERYAIAVPPPLAVIEEVIASGRRPPARVASS